MRVCINSPEELKFVYTAYSGRVLNVETHIGTAIQGGTTNSVITGKDLYITSTSVEFKRAKVALPNGRVKEFPTDGVEMQEGDEVEFIAASNGSNIYVKNATTGDWDIADLDYTRSQLLVPVAGIACLAVVGYGIFFIFQGKSFMIFMIGLLFFLVGSISLILMIKIRAASIKKLEADFQKKVRASGITVPSFKNIKKF